MENPIRERLRHLPPSMAKALGVLGVAAAVSIVARLAHRDAQAPSLTYEEVQQSAGFHATPFDAILPPFPRSTSTERKPNYSDINPHLRAEELASTLDAPANIKEFVAMAYLSRYTMNERAAGDEGVNNSATIERFVDEGHTIEVATMLATLERMDTDDVRAASLVTLNLPPFSDVTYRDFVAAQESVNQTIIALGGQLNPTGTNVRYKGHTANSVLHPGAPTEAIMLVQKETIGTVGDVDVIRRISFVLRTDASSHYPQELKVAIASAGGVDVEAQCEAGRIREVFSPFALQAEIWSPDHSTVVPLSINLYAVKTRAAA